MHILYNDESTAVENSISLLQLLENQGVVALSGVAVALNFSVIPREQWGQEILKENDQVLVVQATQGG